MQFHVAACDVVDCFVATASASGASESEYCVMKDVFSEGAIHKRIEKTFDENIEKMQEPACQEDILLQAELCNPSDLTPLTPSFEFSNHGKDTSKSQFSTRRFLPSPVSSFTFLLPYGSSPGCSGSSSNQDMLLNVRNENEDAVSYHQESDHRNVERVDEFSPRFDGLSNVCDASTQPSHCSTAMASSVSSEKGGWTTISRSAQLSPRSGHLSSADDTPEILNDSPAPLNAVKVSSPTVLKEAHRVAAKA